jgi:hypothetical protein
LTYECVCDYGDAPDVYATTAMKARVPHKCYECGSAINPGEQYERNASLYDGYWTIAKTCCRCLSLREYVLAHAPCFCWMHGSMLDDAWAVIEEHGHVSEGFFIGAMKRYIRVTGRPPSGYLRGRELRADA